MNKTSIYKRALAIGWRVLFVLLIAALLTGAAIWWLAPDIKTLRPQIESYLKKELALDEVELGWLNWYWAGHLGITSDACSFRTRDGSVAVEGSRIAVYFSTWDLIRGDFLPDSIHLHDGDIQLEIKEDEAGAAAPLPPVRLVLDNMHLNWRAKGYAGDIAGLTFSVDGAGQQWLVRFPGLSAQVTLDADGLPQRVAGEFLELDWVPAELRQGLKGSLAGNLTLTRQNLSGWKGALRLNGGETAAIVMPAADFTLPFSALEAEIEFRMRPQRADGMRLERFVISHLLWSYGENSVRGKGAWEAGRLRLEGSTRQVAMPLLWSWLRPLDDGDWDLWLGKMEQGTITEAVASLSLNWPAPWRALPDLAAVQAMKYHVKGVVEGADVALGLDAGSIVNTRADVELDERGLQADISHTELHDMEATASGTLHIPWDTLVLNVEGRGEADTGKLHAWLDAEDATTLGWGAAPAAGSFKLLWMPEEDDPRDVEVRLQPKAAWTASPNGVPVRLLKGEMVWRLHEGLSLRDAAVETPHLSGTLTARAKRQKGGIWEIMAFEGEGSGELAALATDFHLPIEAPDGRMTARLKFEDRWRGSFDFVGASWRNLLGTQKTVGEPFAVRFTGNRSRQGVITLEEIVCRDALLQLDGSGMWSDAGLKLHLRQVKTAAFNGEAKVHAPFGPDPWELDVRASYLQRSALPARLNWSSGSRAKPWALRANIERFDWGDARIGNVSVQLASARNSVGVFKADAIRTESLRLDRVNAIFALPGEGRVDLRHFAASLDQLNLSLSASLTPEAEGGMRWRGFATLDGNFGNMMKRAELSDLFEEGDMHVLFSGQGILLREQAWWEGLSGRLRLRVDDGRILKGGTLSKVLAAVNVLELPALFTGDRKDLTERGLGYRRLQSEALLQGKRVDVRKFALRSSAMDIAGHGKMDVAAGDVDMIFVARPFQNLDALLARVPIVRDLFGGSAHSLIRRVYRLHGPIADASVEEVSPEKAGLASPGIVEHLLGLPNQWFGPEKKEESQ